MTLPSAQSLSQKLDSPLPSLPCRACPLSSLSLCPAFLCSGPPPHPRCGLHSRLVKVSFLQTDLQLKTPKHQGSGCLWEVVAAGIDQEGTWGTFWGDENDLYPDRGWVTQVYEFVKIRQIYTSGMCTSLVGNFTSKEKKMQVLNSH